MAAAQPREAPDTGSTVAQFAFRNLFRMFLHHQPLRYPSDEGQNIARSVPTKMWGGFALTYHLPIEREERVLGWWRKSRKPKYAQALPLNAALLDGEGEPLYNAVAEYRSASNKTFITSQNAMIEVQALEERYAVRLPEDFRSYLLYAAPATLSMNDIGTQRRAATIE